MKQTIPIKQLRKPKRIHLNFSQIIALTFLGIILLGTLLLMLPVSGVDDQSCGLLTALFTATSSVCVTGLSLVDLYSTFSGFGQLVILLLIQVGGLGFMSVVALLFHAINHPSDLLSLLLMAESIGSDDLHHIARVQKRLLIGSFLIEGIGALILFFSFIPTLGIPRALWYGIFHSISAFCNAGFDLMGVIKPGSSLTLLQTNPVVLITIALLIIIGGIGFIVWDDLAINRNIRRCSLNTRLVLIMTGGLLLFGTISFFFMEYHNPDTIGTMSFLDKIVNSFFQSATLRTGGFAAIDQSQFTGSSIALSMLFMAIGGCAGSTAGGIKTLTFLVLVLSILAGLVGKKQVVLFHRRISQEQISYATTVVCSFFFLTFIGGFLIELTSHIGFMAAFYESVSALATVGLSLGVTAIISLPAKLLLVLFMFFGRVGLLTITLGFFKIKEHPDIKYPTAKIMIG